MPNKDGGYGPWRPLVLYTVELNGWAMASAASIVSAIWSLILGPSRASNSGGTDSFLASMWETSEGLGFSKHLPADHLCCTRKMDCTSLSLSSVQALARGDWDHNLCRALVLLKQSPWLLGTILDGLPIRHSIPACWHSFFRPRKDDRPS